MQQQNLEQQPTLLQEGLGEIQRYHQILEGNKNYVAKKLAIDPEYFNNLAQGQQPKFLLIGCSDSRAPPNELTETEPGDIFIHRNIANLVIPTDLNINCVIQYAVEHLKVTNIIVMGHTKCGGVKAALNQDSVGGLLDLWLNNIKNTYEKYQELIETFQEEDDRVTCLSCFSIKEQVLNVWKNPIIQKSWKNGNPIMVHGWLLRVETGFIEEITINDEIPQNLASVFKLQFAKSQDQPNQNTSQKESHLIKPSQFQQLQDQIVEEARKAQQQISP